MPGQKSRHFGNIRKLPSGLYQARYRGPDGRMRSAPHTFARKSDAASWLTLKEAEIRQGDWIDPDVPTGGLRGIRRAVDHRSRSQGAH